MLKLLFFPSDWAEVRIYFIIWWLLLLIFPSETLAWRGTKFIRNYSRDEYKSQPQNWNIVQDRRGFIIVANNGSVLEYDGGSWKEFPLPRLNPRSLDIDENGGVFIGGNNDFGLFISGEVERKPEFRSLSHLVEKKYREFGYVWRTYCTRDGVFFCASRYIFHYRRQKINVLEAVASFSPPILCDDVLYVRQKDVGLGRVVNGAIQLLPGCDLFAADSLFLAASRRPGALLLGAREKGLMDYKNGELRIVESEAFKAAATGYIMCGSLLSDGCVAMGTQNNGVFIMDRKGRIKQHFNTSNGLRDNKVSHIFQDSWGDLWLAQTNWIAKIEYNSPFTLYDDRHGLNGMALTVACGGFGNTVYVGASNGVYYMEPAGSFLPVPGIPGNCFSLLPIDDEMMAAGDKGVFLLKGNKTALRINDGTTYRLFPPQPEGWPLLAGTQNGLTAFFRDPRNGRLIAGKYLEEIHEEIRSIVRDQFGSLWLGAPKKGVIRVSNPARPVIRRYDISQFHDADDVSVYHAAGHVIIATNNGLYRWNERQDVFIPDDLLGKGFAGGPGGQSVKLLAEDTDGRLWIHSKARNLAAVPRENGGYTIYEKLFRRLPVAPVFAICPDLDGPAVWLAGANGLIRVNAPELIRWPPASFRCYIRETAVEEDSLSKNDGSPSLNVIYSGYGPPPVFPGGLKTLPYQQRNLRFTFAAPFYKADEQMVYRCFLEGRDRHWSAWSTETHKGYDNLDPGIKRFRVEAKNVYGDISREVIFVFKILPPWYRAWWAFFIYAAAGLLTVLLLLGRRSVKFAREKKRLEDLVTQRTLELHRKNEQLQEMASIKSRFFANISHEFRTPLTLILGPIEQMLMETADKSLQKKYKMMRRNAQRLLTLINRLLELSKLDNGAVRLNASPRDMVAFLKGVIASFEPAAAARDLELMFHAEEENIMTRFDPDKMEEVCFNLLSNAVKFTPSGGQIDISVSRRNPEDPSFPNGFTEIVFCDTGPGIPHEQMEYIFDRFFYTDYTDEKGQKGAGIGLALVKELVALHRGSICVDNADTGGACFTVRLPLDPKLPSSATISDIHPVNVSSPLPHPFNRFPEEGMELEEDSDSGATPPPVTGEKEIILVVDDSSDVRGYIRDALEPDYSVLEAKNGKIALETAFQVIPDLIVSDIMMPETDGLVLCQTLKKHRDTSHIPIILLTAKASDENILQGLETSADDYITKPFNIRLLVARIRNLIELRRQLQQNRHREMMFQPVKTDISSLDQTFFHDLHSIMEKHLDDSDFNVDELARKLYMGRTTVYRKIEALCGLSPGDYIRSYRLKRAAQLLRQGVSSVTEVAFQVGFSSRGYFTKCFREMFQQLPSDFMKNQ